MRGRQRKDQEVVALSSAQARNPIRSGAEYTDSLRGRRLSRNAIGYLMESMREAGSPQAQRLQIARSMQIEFKKELAKTLAGVADASRSQISNDLSTYMARVFAPIAD